ncbi:MAG: hypothetical protein QNL61_10955 [Crocinitomicaceae bacterium]
MRVFLIIIGLAIFVLSNSCKKIDELTKFEMEYDATVVIPSSSGINLPFNIYSPSVSSNAEATFEINDTRKDLIEEILLKEMVLRVDAPNGGDFGFLESVEIFINAQDLDELKIAWYYNVPDSQGSTLDIFTTAEDLKEYIKKDNFTLRVNTVTDEILTSDYHINIFSRFFVDAKILGQ